MDGKIGVHMDRKSIAVLKKLFKTGEMNEAFITELRQDDRKGVQDLIKQYEKQLLKEKMLENKFTEMSRFEQVGYIAGNHYIAGVDEAGRGPLAGPVVAAAVILPADFKLLGLDDSKQLNETMREQFSVIIKDRAISYGVSIIDSPKIDEINIFEATKLAMYGAVDQLNPKPDHVLIDAVNLKGLPCTHEAITKGDAKSVSIAAASILAKVTRDKLMREMHDEYPMYDFAANMGYGTKQHIQALETYGASPYHRRSFAPVKNVVY